MGVFRSLHATIHDIVALATLLALVIVIGIAPEISFGMIRDAVSLPEGPDDDYTPILQTASPIGDWVALSPVSSELVR